MNRRETLESKQKHLKTFEVTVNCIIPLPIIIIPRERPILRFFPFGLELFVFLYIFWNPSWRKSNPTPREGNSIESKSYSEEKKHRNAKVSLTCKWFQVPFEDIFKMFSHRTRKAKEILLVEILKQTNRFKTQKKT